MVSSRHWSWRICHTRTGRPTRSNVGKAGLERTGKRKWRKNVEDVANRLSAALEVDDVVIGGGNAKLLGRFRRAPDPARTSMRLSADYRLWGQQ